MRQFAIALLATTMISGSALAASNGPQQQNAPAVQGQNSQGQPQSAKQQGSQNHQNQQNIRQVQQALNKDGFSPGRIDGRWGPETQNALKQFQQSKNVPASGQLDQQTVADLGLNPSQFSQEIGKSGQTTGQAGGRMNHQSNGQNGK